MPDAGIIDLLLATVQLGKALALDLVRGMSMLLPVLPILAVLLFVDWWRSRRQHAARRYHAKTPPTLPLIPWQEDVSVLDDPAAFGYQVYTHEFDDEITAETLLLPPDRQTLYRHHLAHTRAMIAQVLGTPQSRFALPPIAETAVTLLIDNSGSLRTRERLPYEKGSAPQHDLDAPISRVATLVSLLAATLTSAGATVEVLGFTTRSWKGGESRKKWIADGKPANPGRLCDLRHIIYKPASSPWEQSCANIAVMLSEALLKENLDGEAVQWAYRRLNERSERRRILAVISDGAPVDDSTLLSNDNNILSRHLRHVIREIEKRGIVELRALGIDYGVENYYTQALRITSDQSITPGLAGKVAEFILSPPVAHGPKDPP